MHVVSYGRVYEVINNWVQEQYNFLRHDKSNVLEDLSVIFYTNLKLQHEPVE